MAMEVPFDPYLKWLAISDPQRPPNHYTLLGVRVFETDAEVISNAADRQMAHVRTFQIGAYSAQSQLLLNELAAARVVLLNPQKKQAYDSELRAKLVARKRAAPRTTAPMPSPAAPVVAAATNAPSLGEYSVAPIVNPTAAVAPSAPTIEIATGSSRPIRRKTASGWIPLAGTLIATLGLVGVAAWILNKPLEVAHIPAANAPGAATASPSPSAVTPVPATLSTSDPSGDTESTPVGPQAVASPPADAQAFPAEGSAADDATVEPSDEVSKAAEGESVGDASNPASGATDTEGSSDRTRTNEGKTQDSDEQIASDQASPTAERSSAAAASDEVAPAASPSSNSDPRAVVPSSAAQAKATEQLEEAYGVELAGAKSSESKATLALKLLNEGVKSEADRAAQYVLLARSTELAAEGEDLATALKAADLLEEKFRYSAIKAKVDAAEVVLKKVNVPTLVRAAIEESLAVAESALAQDAFREASQVLEAVRKAARKAKDPSLAARLKRIGDLSRAIEKEYGASRKAADTLKADPDDPDANSVLGAYTCFYKHAWEEGLPLLKKGANPDFRRVATLDQQKPQAADKQLEVADQWWDLAQQSKGPAQRACEARAVFWYEKALPRLSGLNQSKASDRVFVTIFGKTKLWTTNPKDGGANLGHAESRFPSECTVELWFSTSANTGTLITKRQQEPEGSLTLVIQDGRLRGWANGSFYLVEVHGDQTVNDGKWHHVALVKTSGQMQLYVDGRPGGTAGVRDDYNSQSPWTLGIHRINTSHAGPIDARYCRIRFSATARYTGPFKPDQRYGADQATVFLE
ncbi:MAG: hypothetical protein K2Y37_23395 [Pirellulales bacterium]|nr:hypothetical protein [Pirellulales bacterium]